MNTTILPDSIDHLFQNAFTPEFWRKAFSILIAAVLILVVFRVLQVIVSRAIKKTMPEQKAQLVKKAIQYTGWVIAIVSVLESMGVNLSALLGAAGIAGIAIGLAAQTSVSNLISGIFLISEKSFQIGDVIQVGDISGIIMSIDLLSIKLQTFDNRFVRIPNESIIKSNVINNTRFPIRRLDVWVSVSYNSDLKKVTETLKDIASKNLNALNNPEPLIYIDKFDISGVSILFGVWFEQSKLVDLRNSIIMDIQRRFAEEGIEIPYPKRDVYIKGIADTQIPDLRSDRRGAECRHEYLIVRGVDARPVFMIIERCIGLYLTNRDIFLREEQPYEAKTKGGIDNCGGSGDAAFRVHDRGGTDRHRVEPLLYVAGFIRTVCCVDTLFRRDFCGQLWRNRILGGPEQPLPAIL
jgi:small-conductance mechanosensitive channel